MHINSQFLIIKIIKIDSEKRNVNLNILHHSSIRFSLLRTDITLEHTYHLFQHCLSEKSQYLT